MRRLIAVVTALLVVFGGFSLFQLSGPSIGQISEAFEEAPYYSYANYAESKSPKVLAQMIQQRNAAGDSTKILMGSSELDGAEMCSSHPVRFFGEHNYGMSTISIGNAGYQSLWQAIEVGALDQTGAVPDKKVALIVGMQWFMDGGCSPEAFQHSFSLEAYNEFCANPSISSETKQAVADRVEELGVSAGKRDLSGTYLPDRIDGAVDSFFSSRDIRESLLEASFDNYQMSDQRLSGYSAEPDWDAWLQYELKEGESKCISNDVGVYDEYYHRYYEPWLEAAKAQGSPSDSFDGWSESTECGDFQLFLQVCNELGIEPLIIIMPVKASYYDCTVYDKESRDAYYDLIRSMCDNADAPYADFSAYDYETYFMKDVMHFGWTGWVHVNRALYDFYSPGE